MNGFIEGEARSQATLFPERIDDYICEENPVRVVDVFVNGLDLAILGFRTEPAATGRPAYHPITMLKLFIYGYLNRIQSSRRLEREAGRNLELMWLLGRLAPDFKTIADFRKNNGKGIRKVCSEFVQICRRLELFSDAFVAIEGKTINKYWSSNCPQCVIKDQCTTEKYRRVARWEHEDVLNQVEARIEKEPERMAVRRTTVEHPFGTIKSWMGATHFQMKTLKHVSTEMSLHVLAYNLMRILGINRLMKAVGA